MIPLDKAVASNLVNPECVGALRILRSLLPTVASFCATDCIGGRDDEEVHGDLKRHALDKALSLGT